MTQINYDRESIIRVHEDHSAAIKEYIRSTGSRLIRAWFISYTALDKLINGNPHSKSATFDWWGRYYIIKKPGLSLSCLSGIDLQILDNTGVVIRMARSPFRDTWDAQRYIEGKILDHSHEYRGDPERGQEWYQNEILPQLINRK